MNCRAQIYIVVLLSLSLQDQRVFIEGSAVECSRKYLSEGQNVIFLCELNSSPTCPLYWSINDLVFTHYSLPEVFVVPGNRGYVRLPRVDRRMSDWRLQCICGDTRGNCHITNVFGGLQNNDTAESLLHSFERGPALEYQVHQGAESDRSATITWNYSPQSTNSCACSTVERYNISVYRSSDVRRATSQSELPDPLETLSATENRINISRELMDGNYYLHISAIHGDGCNCSVHVTEAPFLYGYSPNATTTRISANGADSVTFELPELLHNDSSLQLIWQKDESPQQCVCPLHHRELSRCACNVQSPDNTVAIVNGISLTVSNLTQVMEKGISVVSTVLRGHLNSRTVIRIVRIEDIISTSEIPARSEALTSETPITTSETPTSYTDTTTNAAKEIGGTLGTFVVLASIALANTLLQTIYST